MLWLFCFNQVKRVNKFVSQTFSWEVETFSNFERTKFYMYSEVVIRHALRKHAEGYLESHSLTRCTSFSWQRVFCVCHTQENFLSKPKTTFISKWFLNKKTYLLRPPPPTSPPPFPFCTILFLVESWNIFHFSVLEPRQRTYFFFFLGGGVI